jgi:integrase
MSIIDHKFKPQQVDRSHRFRSLADIMGSVQKADIPKKRKAALTTSLNTVARVLGKSLSEIPAQPASLRTELSKASYLLAGVKKNRWRDIRSLTLKALQIGGVKLMPGRRRRSSFAPAWVALRQTINPRYQMGLSRFMNFCSTESIDPNGVDAAIFEAFHTRLLEGSLVPHAENVYRETCRLWDRAGITYGSWPEFRVGPLPEVHRYSLPWSAYPPSFHADVEAFLTRAADDNIYARGREYFRPLKPTTIEGHRRRLKIMATALVKSGFPAMELTSLAVMVQPENARKILEFFWLRAGKVKKDTTYSKACLIRTIARNWVKNQADMPQLNELCRVSKYKKKGLTKRNRDRLRQFDDPRNLQALLATPEKLMRLARQRDIGDEQAARNAMCAVAIEILTVTALRINNVAELELGSTIIMPTDLKRGKAYISLPGHQVKNGVDLEFELPKSTVALIQEYVKDFRPRFSDKPSAWLFPNTFGAKRNTAGFSRLIKAKLAEHAGLEMNAHLFRHSAVKIMQSAYPDAYESWRRLLGHKHLDTTLNHYAEAQDDLARQRFSDLIESKRSDPLGPKRKSKVKTW